MSIVTAGKNDRLMFFIDTRNVIKGCSEAANGYDMVDFAGMVDIIADGRPVAAAYIFDGRGYADEKGNNRSVSFHQRLEYQGFRVKIRDSYTSEQRTQKEVDMDMGTEMLMQAFRDSYDVAVVVSGDRDFVPAIEKVQLLGKRVEAAAFEGCIGKEKSIMRAADRFHSLNTMPIVIIGMNESTESEDIPSQEPAFAEAE